LDSKQNKPTFYAFGAKLTSVLADIFNLPLTIITSPKGYGKQLAVSAYILNTNALSLWLNIPRDTDKKGFLQYLENTLFAADSSASTPFLPTPDGVTGASETIAVTYAIHKFAAARGGRETVVVIDNFQNLRPSEQVGVLDLLHGIASSFIQRFHIVLLSDCLMPVHTRSYHSEFVREIGKQLLKLDEPEIAAIFRYYGISITAEETKRILLFSEGWLYAISALILACLEANRFDESVVETAGRSMVRYIYDSIWVSLPRPERNLIIMMAGCESFTRAQARFVCLRSGITRDADQLLQSLINQHVLIDYDRKNDSFTFHHLLRQLAEEEAQKLPPGDAVLQASRELAHGYEAQSMSLDLSLLSVREMEVYALLFEGYTYRNIGEALYISLNTVKTNIKNIYRKLGVNGRDDLMARVGEQGGEP
jgi:ATP/maltotriose-dependent transcriptional regulator MalT